MKRTFFLLVFGLCTNASFGQQALNIRLDSIVNAYAQLNWNAVVVVGKGNDILYTKAIGYADIDVRRPLTLEALFQTASVGKMFTSTRIMQLLKEGKIDLTTPVDTFLPEWKIENLDKINIHQLLTHTSGLASPWDHPAYDFTKEYTAVEMKQIIEEVPLAFKHPGERQSYSNIGYTLLGEIIAKVDKMPYQSSITQHIFQPAGIKNYSTIPEAVFHQLLAKAYYQVSGKVFTPDPDMIFHSFKPGSGAGGWLLSATDLYRFTSAYLNGVYLDTATQRLQLTANGAYSGAERNNRYGVATLNSKFARPHLIFGHNGGGKGYSADAYFDPQTGYTVVMCSNMFATGYAITANIFRALYNEPINKIDPLPSVVVVDHMNAKGTDYLINQPDSFFKEIKLTPSEFLFSMVCNNLRLSKDYKSAAALLTVARNKLPDAIGVWMDSGDLALLMNQKDQARDYYLKALALSKAKGIDVLTKQIDTKLSALPG